MIQGVAHCDGSAKSRCISTQTCMQRSPKGPYAKPGIDISAFLGVHVFSRTPPIRERNVAWGDLFPADPEEPTPRACVSSSKERSRGIGKMTIEQQRRKTEPELDGGCLCGKIRFHVGSDLRVHYCHCDMCRRATGSAFAVLAWAPVQGLTWDATAPTYRRSSPIARRGFCPDCGTPLTLAYDASPGEIALHVGSFDDPARLEPRYNYGSGQRLGWVCCGTNLPDHDTKERW